MGNKYMADCSTYPYKGYVEHAIQGEHLLPFLVKVLIAAWKYPIINIMVRRC